MRVGAKKYIRNITSVCWYKQSYQPVSDNQCYYGYFYGYEIAYGSESGWGSCPHCAPRGHWCRPRCLCSRSSSVPGTVYRTAYSHPPMPVPESQYSFKKTNHINDSLKGIILFKTKTIHILIMWNSSSSEDANSVMISQKKRETNVSLEKIYSLKTHTKLW